MEKSRINPFVARERAVRNLINLPQVMPSESASFGAEESVRTDTIWRCGVRKEVNLPDLFRPLLFLRVASSLRLH